MRLMLIGLLLVLSACSTGLQERAFKNEHGVFIVSQSLVNDRVTANQPHINGQQACMHKYTSEQMVDLRKDGEEHSWYHGCQKLEDYKPGMYQITLDQPVGTIYKGPVEAAVLGAAVGTGLALSGPEVTQQGGGASSSSNATAKSRGSRGHRR